MFSYNMIGWLWMIMTIAINNVYIVSGDPGHHSRRLSRSCEARNVDNPCLNDGQCHVTLSAGDAAEPALVTCRCPPAWTGATCELERDPCTDGSAICGPGWSCVRNSSNTAAGYDCGCSGRSGWRRLQDGVPRCVDVDECSLLLPACYNGGRCYNQAGTFNCVCKPGFTGGRCQVGALPSRSADGWHAWSAWSRCGGPCGAGLQRRARICGRRRSGCQGEPEQSRTCVPSGCRGHRHRPWWGGDGDGTWREDSDDQAHEPSHAESRKAHRRKARKRNTMEVRRVGEEGELGRVNEATDSDAEVGKTRWWRDTRKVDSLAQNWKLVHFLGFEPVRRKRSLAQIESYDDLELALMKNDPRAARDLGKEQHDVNELSQSAEAHERVRRSPKQAYVASVWPDLLVLKRSIDNMKSTTSEQTLSSSEDLNIIVKAAGSQESSAIEDVLLTPSDPAKSSDGKHLHKFTSLTIGSGTDSSKVHQNVSSVRATLTDSSLEEALRRPAAAVRALVGPVVGRARAALLRLRLTEAARAEQQEAALAAAEAAERQLHQAQQEAGRRTAARQAAEHRLWQLLDRTEVAARRGAEAQRAAKQEAARREAAETRLEEERRRRRQLRQDEAAAAARHSVVRARLLRRVQAARRQAVTQSAALETARRQAESAEKKAHEAEAERRQQRQQLRQLKAAEKQKLVELQQHGAERLSAELREAEKEERRAQEAEHAWKQAEHRTRPQPEPEPEPPPEQQGQLETALRIKV